MYVYTSTMVHVSQHPYKIVVLCHSADIYVKAQLHAGKIKSSLSPVRTGSFTPQFKGSQVADSEGTLHLT